MSRIIQHKRGKEKDLPDLSDGEFGVTLDSKKLFYGSGGNQEVARKDDVATVNNNLLSLTKTDRSIDNFMGICFHSLNCRKIK